LRGPQRPRDFFPPPIGPHPTQAVIKTPDMAPFEIMWRKRSPFPRRWIKKQPQWPPAKSPPGPFTFPRRAPAPGNQCESGFPRSPPPPDLNRCVCPPNRGPPFFFPGPPTRPRAPLFRGPPPRVPPPHLRPAGGPVGGFFSGPPPPPRFKGRGRAPGGVGNPSAPVGPWLGGGSPGSPPKPPGPSHRPGVFLGSPRCFWGESPPLGGLPLRGFPDAKVPPRRMGGAPEQNPGSPAGARPPRKNKKKRGQMPLSPFPSFSFPIPGGGPPVEMPPGTTGKFGGGVGVLCAPGQQVEKKITDCWGKKPGGGGGGKKNHLWPKSEKVPRPPRGKGRGARGFLWFAGFLPACGAPPPVFGAPPPCFF